VPTATAWTATTDCGDAFGCTSALFQVAAGKTPIGISVSLPFTPNAMLFNPAGTRIYLGSKKGLMFFDLSATSVSTVSSATTPCNVAVCGKPIAISADGNRVVVADTDTVPNQVYIFDSTKAAPPVDLLVDGATAAAFSPDQMKVFILTTTGKMFVYSTVDSLLSVPVSAGVTDLAFAADGSFAYVAGTPGSSVSAFSTCEIPGIGSVDLGSVGTPRLPSRIAPSPDVQEFPLDENHSRITQKVIALEPGDAGSSTRIQSLTAQFQRNPLPENQFTCNLPVLSSFTASSPVDLGFGNFTPLLMQVTGDGSKVILVAENVPAVLVFDLASGTTQSIGLVNNPAPLAAAASLDGTQVFVAACDADHENPNTCGSVHIVNIVGGGDIQQAVYTNINTNDSICNGLDVPCLPNLIAVRPQ
jgi:DNA-binding beta-propeller fold protein YncE